MNPIGWIVINPHQHCINVWTRCKPELEAHIFAITADGPIAGDDWRCLCGGLKMNMSVNLSSSS